MMNNLSNAYGQGARRAQCDTIKHGTPTPSIRGIFVAGRGSGTETLLNNAAWLNNCRLRLEIDRGWIEHTYRFEFEGDDAKQAVAYLLERADAGSIRFLPETQPKGTS